MKEDFDICEMCGARKATIFFKKSINGVIEEKHLCQHCADILQQSDLIDNLFDSNSMWAGLYGFMQPNAPTKIRVCKCKTTEKDVLDNYKFGCSECYTTFSDIAEKFVKKLGGVTYNGNQPKHFAEKEKQPLQHTEKQSLMQQLEDAVAKEDFLLANELKQKIKSMEAKKDE